MGGLLIILASFVIQMNTLQSKPVVHLAPHHVQIEIGFGGKEVRLVNSPATVFLPPKPPRMDSEGNAWTVDVKNLGPSAVTIMDVSMPTLKVVLNVNQTVHFYWNGSTYRSD